MDKHAVVIPTRRGGVEKRQRRAPAGRFRLPDEALELKELLARMERGVAVAAGHCCASH